MCHQLHYGEHDPCLVTQLFNEQTGYLCLILYSYASDATNTSPWTIPDKSDFEPIDGHKLLQDPLGIFPPNSVRTLEIHYQALLISFSQLAPSQKIVSSTHNSRMKDYKTRIRFLLSRLQTPMLWDEAIHCWALAQRCVLELEALQTWVSKVGPTWDTQPPFVVHVLRDVVGAMTEKPDIAQKLYQVRNAILNGSTFENLTWCCRLVFRCGFFEN